jgi:SAM-dependent methyltransferase
MKVGKSTVRIRPDKAFIYNGAVGNWWRERAADGAHRHAYVKIANFIRNSIRRDPRLIVDYACGAGNLLSLLCRRFPHSRLAGLDGSSLLLSLAEERLSRLSHSFARRISLIETSLPGPARLRQRADLIIFCFPNMMPSRSREKTRGPAFRLSEKDTLIAKNLSKSIDPETDGDDVLSPRAIRRALEDGRLVSKNLRNLLVRGGICVRVEYATTRRHEWSPLELLCVSFEEGSLDTAVNGIRSRPWFHVLASAFFRSRVLEDVYQQTGDEMDKGGGYLITVLRAV